MKRKNLILTLASILTVVLMMVLMAGCGGSSDEPETSTEALTTTEAEAPTEAESTTESATTTTTAAATTTEAVSIKAVSETVWAVSDVNVRADSNVDSQKVGMIKKGDKIKRTGILSNGWSRIDYNGKDMYVSSKYLTEKNPKPTTTTTKATKTKTTTKATTTKATKTKAPKTTTKATTTKAPKTTTKATTAAPTTTEPTTAAPTTTEPTTTEPTTTEPTTTEPTTTEATTTVPKTVTDQGICTDFDTNKKTITLDNKNTYNIEDAQVDVKPDEALENEVGVEYYDGTNDAVHVYLVPADKAIGGDASSAGGGATKIAIILALIAIAIAVIIVAARNRRRNA